MGAAVEDIWVPPFFLCPHCGVASRPGSISCTECSALFSFTSKGIAPAGESGTSGGITSAGSGEQPITPAAAVTKAAQKQYFERQEKEQIWDKYWHKGSQWGDLNDRINRLLKHKSRWIADPEYRVKCASRGGILEVAGDRGVGSWTLSGPFAKPPKAASIDDTLLRLMQAAEIMQPVEGLSPTDPAYLTKREEAMAAFYSDYEKRPVERLLELSLIHI